MTKDRLPGLIPPIAPLNTWAARQVSIYDRLNQIGEGTFGNVFKAQKSIRVSSTGNSTKQDVVDYRQQKKFALKRIKFENNQEGFPITALRQIKILKRLNHRNVVKLQEVVVSHPNQQNGLRGNVYLVFDYAPADLQGLLDHKIQLSMPQIKCLIIQILQGLIYLHDHNVIHRDIKGANMLITDDGVLKLGDFGLAREVSHPGKEPLTNRVVTLWYRAPQLLLGEMIYTGKIDVWSVGCVLAQMLIGKPLFPGNKQPEQMIVMYNVLGPIKVQEWPEVVHLKHWGDLKMKEGEIYRNGGTLNDILQRQTKYEITANCLDFLRRTLRYNHKSRLSAKQALNHPFLKSELPMPCPPSELPKIQKPCHELRTQKHKKNHQQPQFNKGGGQNRKHKNKIPKNQYLERSKYYYNNNQNNSNNNNNNNSNLNSHQRRGAVGGGNRQSKFHHQNHNHSHSHNHTLHQQRSNSFNNSLQQQNKNRDQFQNEPISVSNQLCNIQQQQQQQQQQQGSKIANIGMPRPQPEFSEQFDQEESNKKQQKYDPFRGGPSVD